jgi:peptidoglycan-associated lipoprotein
MKRVSPCVSILIVIAAAGCAKKAPAVAQSAPPPAVEAPPPAPPMPPPAAVAAAPAPTEEELFARLSLDELNAQRPLGIAYFDLDSAEIRDDARQILQRNAEWLKRWASTQISVEGHCDERGSGEYNLALGERRANAIKGYLVNLGIAADRVTVVSKGKEVPECTLATEGCWQQNRRGAPVITAK